MVFYKFLVLPFGLSSACYVFSKICRPLVGKWRGEGKLVTMFLDDGFGCAQDFDKAENLSQEIKNDFLMSGFVPNATKSVWIPVQRGSCICAHAWILFKLCIIMTRYIQTMKMYILN